MVIQVEPWRVKGTIDRLQGKWAAGRNDATASYALETDPAREQVGNEGSKEGGIQRADSGSGVR
jgi:hypothetical protein